MPNELIVSGTILYGDSFDEREGYLVIRDGIIDDVRFERHEGDINGIICPAFINAHTHVGDSLAKDLPYMPLVKLVAPPDGLKHRILGAASLQDISSGIESTLRDMAKAGTYRFIDFRENGVDGVRVLRNLAGDRAMILGRATSEDTWDRVLECCDGAGISGANDMPRDTLLDAVQKAKKAGKTAGIHAGELNRSDIDTAIDVMPDFLVHMTQATEADIKRVADRGLPVVTCPRSNAVTGVGAPPIRNMACAGVELALGTDNVMLNSPDMFREMEWASKAFLHDDAYTLRMATLNGARLMGMEKETGSILPGKRAELIVLNGGSDNLRGYKNALSAVVRRAGPDDVSCFICGDRIWRRYSTEYS